MKIKALALALGISTAMAGSANAAVSLQVSGGKLIGASGVTIGNNTYDVVFKDGTCANIYGTCQSSSFAFNTREESDAAAQALLDQVFVDGAAGRFDSNPSLIFGCSDYTLCKTAIPYFAGSTGYASSFVMNRSGSNDDLSSGTFPLTLDSSLGQNANFARFSLAPVSPVPEPATWTMLLVGFGLIGATARYRRRCAKVTYV